MRIEIENRDNNMTLGVISQLKKGREFSETQPLYLAKA